ncbi:MAG: aquaporin [Phycisphaerae bacterium]|nr:aquaporin [Phycisphaerae bacterium]
MIASRPRELLLAAAIDGALLAAFLFSACAFAVLLFHPAMPATSAIPASLVRRGLMGVAMGLTAMALVYSPLGRRSGAHLNPAVTLTFALLRKVRVDAAVAYVVMQVVGALVGVAAAYVVFPDRLAHASVRFVATEPGPSHVVAWWAEFLLSFVLLFAVLAVASSRRWSVYAGAVAGALVALFIAVEAPLSGMSLNPARSLGSAAFAGSWESLWIYLTAPTGGMALVAVVRRGLCQAHGRGEGCAKLCHLEGDRCVFCEKAESDADGSHPTSRHA